MFLSCPDNKCWKVDCVIAWLFSVCTSFLHTASHLLVSYRMITALLIVFSLVIFHLIQSFHSLLYSPLTDISISNLVEECGCRGINGVYHTSHLFSRMLTPSRFLSSSPLSLNKPLRWKASPYTSPVLPLHFA